MIAAALLLAGASAVAVLPPEEAAGKALMQCVAHATGMGPIAAEYADKIAANGLIVLPAPPEILASTAQNPVFGKASYIEVPSTAGRIWAVGYDGGACLAIALGMPIAQVEAKLVALLAIPGGFVEKRPQPAEPGERKLEYTWPQTGYDLSALVSLREPQPGKGFVMVTINRVTPDK